MQDKPWLKNYPKGMPEFIAPLEFETIPECLEDTINRFPDHPAFTNYGVTLSYLTLKQLSERFAFFMLSLKLQKGERVAIMLPNCLQYPVVLMGALKAGLIAVNTNPLYTATELKHQLIDSGATTLVILENFAHVLAQIVSQTPVKHVIITHLYDLFPWPKSLLARLMIKSPPAYHLPDALFLNQALKYKKHLPLPAIKSDDIALLQYTGGTTGISKGAILTHGNLLSNVSQIKTWITPGNASGKKIELGREIIVTALPLYHIFSLTANFLTFFSLAAENILITNPHDMKTFVKTLKRQKFTCISGVNTLYENLMNAPGFASLDFSNLKLSIAGGMATKASTAERWKKLTHNDLLESYGLTEASPGVAVNPINLSVFSGSIGLPLPSTECEIRNDAGTKLPLGEAGELCVKGPQVMKGYWLAAPSGSQAPGTAPSSQAPAWELGAWEPSATGWLKTGDIAYMDEGGFLYIKDRKKDMILVSGFNVYPAEIEAVVVSHPDIIECAAIGVPDDKTGEAIRLFVVSRNPNLDETGIIEHCRQHLTAYKIPKHVEFRSKLPKSPIGKVLRKALKKSETKA